MVRTIAISGIILPSAMRKLVVLLVGVLLLGIAITAAPEQHVLPAYQLAKVSRGKAVTRVVAAGTVQPVVSVVVSSQVSGQVKEIFVDHNDEVKQGQPIALLDPELFNTRVEQARAEVEMASDAVRIAKDEVTTAEAAVNRAIAERAKAEADSKRYEVMIDLTRRRLERKSVLVKSGAVTASDTDDARAAYETALADSVAATAQVASQEGSRRPRPNSPSRGPAWLIPKPRSGATRQRFTRPKPIWIAP